MLPETILQIIRLSLEVTLEVIRGIPVESRQQMWREHEARLKFWEDLFKKLQVAPTCPRHCDVSTPAEQVGPHRLRPVALNSSGLVRRRSADSASGRRSLGLHVPSCRDRLPGSSAWSLRPPCPRSCPSCFAPLIGRAAVIDLRGSGGSRIEMIERDRTELSDRIGDPEPVTLRVLTDARHQLGGLATGEKGGHDACALKRLQLPDARQCLDLLGCRQLAADDGRHRRHLLGLLAGLVTGAGVAHVSRISAIVSRDGCVDGSATRLAWCVVRDAAAVVVGGE